VYFCDTVSSRGAHAEDQRARGAKRGLRGLTRRSFVKTGAAAAGPAMLGAAVGSPGLALAGSAGTRAGDPCPASDPGLHPGEVAVAPDGRTLWVTDGAATTITAISARTLLRGRSIDVGGAPVDIALLDGGRRAVVVTAFYDRPGLALVDLLRGAVIERFDVGKEPSSVAVAPTAGRARIAYVSGGGQKGTLTKVDLRSGATSTLALDAHPRGLALTPDGNRALVALNGAGAVAIVDLVHWRVERTIATAPFPCRVALAPDGGRALVSHGGLGGRQVSLVDPAAGTVERLLHVGHDPYAIAFGDESRAIVGDFGSGAVTLVDLRTGRRRTVGVGHRPRGLAVAGGRAYVVNEFEGTVTAVRLPRSWRTRARRASGGTRKPRSSGA